MSRIAYQGIAGAFSHAACLDFDAACEPVAFDTFEAALDALESGDCDRACLPVRNSLAGPVGAVTDLLQRRRLLVAEARDVAIRLFCLAPPGVRLEDAHSAASHPMALLQCRRFLAIHGLQPHEAFDTAGAARDLSISRGRGLVAIASAEAGRIYGLEVLASDVQDDASNHTRFVLLSR